LAERDPVEKIKNYKNKKSLLGSEIFAGLIKID